MATSGKSTAPPKPPKLIFNVPADTDQVSPVAKCHKALEPACHDAIGRASFLRIECAAFDSNTEDMVTVELSIQAKSGKWMTKEIVCVRPNLGEDMG